MNTRLAILAAVASLCLVHSAEAQKRPGKTIGPFSDVKVVFPVDIVIQGYWTTVENATNTYTHDFAAYTFNGEGYSDARSVQGIGYSTSPKGDFTSGSLIMTTIYGRSLDPHGDTLALTGYTASAPEATFSNEQFIGKSGTVYYASTKELVSLQELSMRLGSGFDLSPFQGDPSSVVYVFQTTMPAKDIGSPTQGNILTEDFSLAAHVGSEDPNGSFDVGELAGTKFRVMNGNVDVLGVLNGTKGSCVSNPSGNCLDLIGDEGVGEIRSTAGYSLSPAYTYTIDFWADTGELTGIPLDFNVSLGSFSAPATATDSPQHFELHYTPSAAEPGVFLDFASITNVDDQHGPVLSNIVVCTHKANAKQLACTK